MDSMAQTATGVERDGDHDSNAGGFLKSSG
jgi:hypothetical protein